MRKSLTAVVFAGSLLLMSCSTIKKSSTTVDVATPVLTETVADLNVQPKKITFTLNPSASLRRGGEKNVINAAVAEALKANGNADVLVGMQYEIKKRKGLFGTKIKYVTVTGYPATYSNFKTVTPGSSCK